MVRSLVHLKSKRRKLNITIDDVNVEQVSKFQYLGGIIEEKGKQTK